MKNIKSCELDMGTSHVESWFWDRGMQKLF